MSQLIAYILILGYGMFQEFFIRDKSARSLRRQTKVDATTIFYLTSVILCLVVAPILDRLHIFELPSAVGWIGDSLVVIGIVIRAIAMIQLGKFYTRALVVTSQQKLMTRGLYAFMRHPGYAGTILGGLGFGLAQQNFVSITFVALVMICVYSVRIYNEEKMLRKAFGRQYEIYAKHTKRIIPYIF